MVFLDESAMDERTLERRYGRAPRGQRAVVEKYFKRKRKRWSLILSIDINGYLPYLLTQESVTKESFTKFVIEEILPVMNPFPQERSILCMDNAKIHHSPVSLSHFLQRLLTLNRNYKQHAMHEGYDSSLSLLTPLT
jgi:hypothetical protein